MKISSKRELQEIAILYGSLQKIALQNHILSWYTTQHRHQIILYVLDAVFWEEYKN